MARSTARKRALNTLYEADEKGQEILSLLAERIEHPGAQTPLPEYAIDIIRGVNEHLRTIDHALNEYSPSWKVRRMAVVDRNILRMATWEMLYNDEVPDKVAIDEAISLSKTLSDAESPSFIHGLLSAVDDHRDEIHEVIEEAAPVSVDSQDNEDSQDVDDSQNVEGQTGDESANEFSENAQPTDVEAMDIDIADLQIGASEDLDEALSDEAHIASDSELKSEQNRVPEEGRSDMSDSAEHNENDDASGKEETAESKHSQG
jgi:transcription antitermination protein NusB